VFFSHNNPANSTLSTINQRNKQSVDTPVGEECDKVLVGPFGQSKFNILGPGWVMRFLKTVVLHWFYRPKIQYRGLEKKFMSGVSKTSKRLEF
jgi:hypothetical protein